MSIIEKMWYFAAGRLMSFLTIALVLKLSHNFLGLVAYERFFGWFLVEHVFEDYDLTSGKLFLVSEDFRTLIKNLLVITRNFIFLAQVFTPFEFLFVSSFLLIVFIFYKTTLPPVLKKVLMFLCCIFLLQSFLIVDFFLAFFIVTFLLSIGTVVSAFYFCINSLYYYTFFHRESSLIKKKIQFFGLKVFIYTVLLLTTLVLVVLILINALQVPENFINELSIIWIIPYSYLYYI